LGNYVSFILPVRALAWPYNAGVSHLLPTKAVRLLPLPQNFRTEMNMKQMAACARAL
jgi:hypothetical protein